MSEHRIEDIEIENVYRTTCPCGRPVELWYNGGELDRVDCPCGRRHELQHTGIDYVRHDPDPEGTDHE